jgi:imidazolonepropionase
MTLTEPSGQPSLVVHHAEQLVTMDPALATPDNPLGVIPNGAMTIRDDGLIQWVGPSDALRLADYPDAEWLDARGHLIAPGLIDCHTHAIFAGDRADEFAWRLQGVSYQEIAARGGGIRKTVLATRSATKEQLFELTQARLLRMLALGVTTVEIKSGYGLDLDSELRQLRVIRRLSETLPMSIVPTFMGAHDVPPEFAGRTDAYVDHVIAEQLPAVAAEGLAEFCDVFCEAGYFSVEQSRRLLEAAQGLGFRLKIHAEEFVDLGGAVLAGELAATSAEHLLHVSDAGIQSLKTGGTTAVLLPGTAFYLRLKDYAPARKLLDAGVPVAVATDFNPGSCHTENLQLVMTLACLQMGMTPDEVMAGVTCHAARALARESDRGSLRPGYRADFLLADVPSVNAWFYRMGVNPVQQVFVGGHCVHHAEIHPSPTLTAQP